jgi:hypothetical protein
MGSESGDEAPARERSDWGCLGCLFDEVLVFPLAVGAALLVRSMLGWQELAWRDGVLAFGFVLIFWLLFAGVSALIRRRGPGD